MTWHGRGAVGVYAPVAVVAALSQESRSVLLEVSFEIAALHAAIMSSDSLPTFSPTGL
jgi:hypothetical protein